jgi:hypothetical protein
MGRTVSLINWKLSNWKIWSWKLGSWKQAADDEEYESVPITRGGVYRRARIAAVLQKMARRRRRDEESIILAMITRPR